VDLVPVELQERSQCLARVGIVFDQQNADHGFTLTRAPRMAHARQGWRAP
jgi:hypothetical protein